MQPLPMRVGCCRVALWIAAVCLIGGAGMVPARGEDGARRGVKDVRSFLELRRENLVIQGFDISCGAAALATVLRYQHGELVTEEMIAKSMLQHTDAETVRARLGFSLLDLKRYAERHGYSADGYAGLTLADLTQFGPAIVRVSMNVYDHFVVFRGVHQDRVLLADPAYGNRTMPIDDFLAIWRDNIAFVVARADGGRPPDQLSARPSDFNVPSIAAIRAALG